jgi:hypothetical protein
MTAPNIETGQRRCRQSINQFQWHLGTGAGAAGAAGAIAMSLGQWGNCNSNCNGNGVQRWIMLLLQRKTSTIVVVENVQNVWMANIPDVLRFD